MSLQTELEVAQSFHRVAVAERNYERSRVDMLETALRDLLAWIEKSRPLNAGQALVCSEAVERAKQLLS